MKILHLSDTHGLHEHFVGIWLKAMIEEHQPDVLVHSGDFMRHAMNYDDLKEFFEWFKQFEVEHKIMVPGNHDMWCESLENNDYLRNEIVPKDLTLLINESVEIQGVKFWGSPYTPEFYDWGFQLYGNDGQKLWSMIPDDTDVLITHGPAYGTLDVPGEPHKKEGSQGCKFLQERIKLLYNLKAHMFGHIHGSYGQDLNDKLLSVNSSILNEDYKVVNRPQLIEVKL